MRYRKPYDALEVYINAEIVAGDENRIDIVANDIRRYLNCCWGVENINVDTDDFEYNEAADKDSKGGIVDGTLHVHFYAYYVESEWTPLDILGQVESTIQALNPRRIATEYYED